MKDYNDFNLDGPSDASTAVGLVVVLILLFAILVVLVVGESQEQTYRVTPLDPDNTEAVKMCATNNGKAGWLQDINLHGDYVNPPADLYCVTKVQP